MPALGFSKPNVLQGCQNLPLWGNLQIYSNHLVSGRQRAGHGHTKPAQLQPLYSLPLYTSNLSLFLLCTFKKSMPFSKQEAVSKTLPGFFFKEAYLGLNSRSKRFFQNGEIVFYPFRGYTWASVIFIKQAGRRQDPSCSPPHLDCLSILFTHHVSLV